MQIATTHKNTDFDALASLVAASLIYPGTVAILPKAVNPNVKAFLSIHKDMFDLASIDEIELAGVEKLIVVDTNKWSRLEKMEKLRDSANLEILMWDHHDAVDCDIDASWECREKIGATITLMLRALKESGTRISSIQATLFLCGLYEDTGNMTFPSATAEDAYAAGYLLDKGADLGILNTFLQPAYGEKQKDLLFEMLRHATRRKINNYSASINIVNIEGHINNLSIVVHMYREIVNVDVAVGIFVHKENGKCIIIGRSVVSDINIGSVMRSMGGGGHPGAGSALLKSVAPQSVRQWITELLKGNQESSVQVRDLMSSPVIQVTSDTSMSEVARILEEKGCTGLPVIDNGKLRGVISRRDFKKLKKQSQLNSPVKAFMSTKNITIVPEQSPMQAARLMVKHDIGRLPVVEKDQIVGIISRSDAMRYFYDALPE
ncbi:MAG: CBS domain-containing protein [Desulfobacteraceae bacterium]|nr:CBS domain-containing protein [Desulfobacteraceae bacterium]MCF8094206.1 CBS domain-containing protein [Desulfobacteraceae bacterium]